MSLSVTVHGLDILASDVLAGAHLLVIVVRFWYWITLGLVRFPFAFMVAGSLMKRFLRLTGWAEVLYLVVAWTSLLIAGVLRDSIDQFLASLAVSSLLFAGLYVAVGCLEFVVLYGFLGT